MRWTSREIQPSSSAAAAVWAADWKSGSRRLAATSPWAGAAARVARGAIVNFGSTIGHGTWGGDRAFQPTKAAVSGLTRFLAALLAPEVRVNCVAPGLMENTVMSGGAPERFVSTWREAAKLKKTTSIDDVAEQALTFCRAETVTGRTLVIDGGLTFR